MRKSWIRYMVESLKDEHGYLDPVRVFFAIQVLTWPPLMALIAYLIVTRF